MHLDSLMEKLFHLNILIVGGEPLTDKLLAELDATVAALRQQRATTLATSEARVRKYNRAMRDVKPDSFAPVNLLIGTFTVRICNNTSGDDLADRLAAAWNCCLGVPTRDLLPGHYSNLRELDSE